MKILGVDFVVNENKIWIINKFGSLLEFDIDNKNVCYKGKFKGCEVGRIEFCRLLQYKNSLFMIPVKHNYILEYKMDENEFLLHKINDDIEGVFNKDAYIYGDYLYCVPYYSNSEIKKISLDNFTVINKSIIKNEKIDYSKSNNIINDVDCNDRRFFGVITGTNNYFSYDMYDDKLSIYSEKDACNLNSIAVMDKYIAIHDFHTNMIKVYEDENEKLQTENNNNSCRMRFINKNEIFIDSNDNDYEILNVDKSYIENCKKKSCGYEVTKYKTGVFRRYNKEIWYFNKCNCNIENITTKKTYEINISEEDTKIYINELCNDKIILNEGVVDLTTYIKCL